MKKYGLKIKSITELKDQTIIEVDPQDIGFLDHHQKEYFDDGIDVFIGWDDRRMRLYIRKAA